MNFEKIRKEKKMTQIDVAKALKISQATLSSYETGRTEPDLNTLVKIADLYCVSVDSLIGRSWQNSNLIVPEARKSTVQLLLDLPDFAFNLAKSYIEGVSATSSVL